MHNTKQGARSNSDHQRRADSGHHYRSWPGFLVALFLLGLIASGCAVSEEARTSQAIVPVVADHWSVDDEVAECVAAAALELRGTAGLAEIGIDADTVSAEPATVDALLEAEPAAMASCLPVPERLAMAVSTDGGEAEPSCIDGDKLQDQTILAAVFTGDEAATDSLASLDDDAQVALLDAVRGCVDDSIFARLAGLDDPEELAAVLIADPFAPSEWIGDQDTCITDAVLSTVGIERLAELEVDIDNPDFLGAVGDLTEDERADLVAAFEPCGLDDQILRHLDNTEPFIGGCVLAAIPTEDTADVADHILRGRSVTWIGHWTELVSDCADEEVANRFPDLPETSDEYDWVAEELAAEASANFNSVFVPRCFKAGFVASFDMDDIEDFSRAIEALEGGSSSYADEVVVSEFLAEMSKAGGNCLPPIWRVMTEVDLAGVGPEAAACVRANLDPAIAESLLDSVPGWMTGDAAAGAQMMNGYDEITEVVEDCGTTADLRRWELFVDQISYAEDASY